jgi:putative ABC transport system permease protein
MRAFARDLRHAVRILGRQPVFTFAAVVTLALGIGANTAIFSVVNAVLLRPLPYPESERLLLLNENKIDAGPTGVGWLNFLDWRARSRSFEAMAAQKLDGFILTGNGEPRRLPGRMVSASFFDLLGLKPALGRFFNANEDLPRAERTVVLAHHLWRDRFGADPAILGRSILLDNVPHTVVGVAPAELRFGSRVDLYVPVGLWGDTKVWLERSNHVGLRVLARLAPGVSIEAARAEMDTIARGLEAQYPASNTGQRVMMQRLYEDQVGDVRPSLLMLLACVGLVLLITCANIANLILARGASRQREIAVRASLGAGRWQLVRQFMAESLLMAGAGGALGVMAAFWGIKTLLGLAPPDIPRLEATRIDPMVLAFTIGLSLLAGLVSGIAPALQASRLDVIESLKEGPRGGAIRPARRRLQSVFLITQIALSIIVVTGAGLMVRSILAVSRVVPGFQAEGALALDVMLPGSRYAEPASRSAFFSQALDRIRALPGVESAASVHCLPLTGSCWTSVYQAEGLPETSAAQLPISAFNQVSADYFRAMRIPLLEGRSFTPADGASSAPVAIVNARMAQRHWPGASPIGKRIRQGFPESGNPWREIVGVVGDVLQNGPEWEVLPEIYFPYDQAPTAAMRLVMRSQGDGDPAMLAGAATMEVHRLDPAQPVENVRPMTAYLGDSMARRRFSTLLLVMFAALALVLAAVGIYGVVSCSVSERTHEIGVRMALGARAADIARLVLGRGMRLTLTGVTAGLAGAVIVTRFMSGMLFGVTPNDPLTFGAMAALLAGVAMAACWLPARRASRVDPMTVLRLD